jgi:hypothetical protein
MSISVIPPPEFAHVNNPVFVSVAADNAGHTILVDIYQQGWLLYTASAQAGTGIQRFNIAEILQTIVQTPLPWPMPDNPVFSIVNWLAEYRLEVREMEGATAVAAQSSGTLYAVPGGVDDDLFLELSAAGTDIFQTRLLNPAANRFLTVYAGKDDPVITLPDNPTLATHQTTLFFMAKAGETLRIEQPSTGQPFDYTFAFPSLYCVNLSRLPAQAPALFTFNSSKVITVGFEAPATSWPLRTWLFLNHFGVFEPFVTTGRAQTSVTRPDNTASRYIQELDAFHDIDLPSKPVETIKFPSGYTNRNTMQALRHLSLSDWLYLVVGLSLVYYFFRQASRIIADDSLEPHSIDLEATRSIREPLTPVYGDSLVVLYIDPAKNTLDWRPGEVALRVVSIYDGQPAGWSVSYAAATPEGSALSATVTRVDNDTIHVTYPVNHSMFWHSGIITVTQDTSGATATADLTQKGVGLEMLISPNLVDADAEAGTAVCAVTSKTDGVDVDWSAEVTMGADWLSVQKISQTELRIIRQANTSNVKRVGQVLGINTEGWHDTVDFYQAANSTPDDVYVFSLATSGFVSKHPDAPDGETGWYECNIPADGNGTIFIPVTSTKNGVPCPWFIPHQTPGFNAVIESGNLSITPADNTSTEPVVYNANLWQEGSDYNFLFFAYQDGKEAPSYTFRIESVENMNFPKTAESQSLHVISNSGASYVDWTVEIQFFEGGAGWLSVIRDGENVKATTLSNNNSGARRRAVFLLKQAGSGLIDSRSVTQAWQ